LDRGDITLENNNKIAANVLPATTFRWLKLNDLQIDSPSQAAAAPYTKEFLSIGMEYNRDSDAVIRKTNETDSLPQNIKSLTVDSAEYGVSKEFVSECEDFCNSGLFVYIPEGETVTEPIRVTYELDQENAQVIDYNFIYAAANSKVTLVMDYSTLDAAEAYHNGAMKILAKEGASVTIIKIQRMNNQSRHIDSNYVRVDANAKVNFIQIELGSKYSVTNYKSTLNEGGEATIDSIYFGDGTRLIDLNYLMEHAGRRSISNIQTKGALKDHATKTFRGTIDFKKGAGKSEGSEEEYVILFDKTVKSNAVPLLLCSEDDVKGSHAASAGKVDSEKLFYMMSRGFTKEEAMKMIVEASFQPVIEKVPFEELRLIIAEEIHRRLLDEKV
jgi:FeS assembly protein SufD